MTLLLLILMLARLARHGGCGCCCVCGVLSFPLACLEQDNAFGDAGDG